MRVIYVPTHGAGDWRQFLAQPERQRARGYSARTLAHCWEAAAGLPAEISAALEAVVTAPQLLLALPEHKTALPGGRRESQSDVFALIRSREHLIAATVEGKVDEAFGPTVAEWIKEASPGKRVRLDAVCGLLGLPADLDGGIRYQLLHRNRCGPNRGRALRGRRRGDDRAFVLARCALVRRLCPLRGAFGRAGGDREGGRGADPLRSAAISRLGGRRSAVQVDVIWNGAVGSLLMPVWGVGRLVARRAWGVSVDTPEKSNRFEEAFGQHQDDHAVPLIEPDVAPDRIVAVLRLELNSCTRLLDAALEAREGRSSHHRRDTRLELLGTV